MAQHVPQKKIDDCRELYLEHGGTDHDLIVSEMDARGWRGFTKRNLYTRTRNGRITPGWPERFGWDSEIFASKMQKPARKQGLNTQPGHAHSRRRRSKPGIAFATRRTFAREQTPPPRTAMLAPTPPKFNRQKARRLQKEESRRSAGNAGALACTDAAAASGRILLTANSHNTAASPAGGTGGTGEGACAPGDAGGSGLGDKTVPAQNDFHAWLKTLPGIWHWDWAYQRYLYKRLKRVTSGQCKRLMIFMPPRHGKSELVTVRYTAWRLKQDPSMNIILGSYNQQLANKFSRKIKRVLTEDAEQLRNAERREANENWPQINADNADRSKYDLNGPDPRYPRPSAAKTLPPLPLSSGSQSPFPFTRQRPINTVAEWETTEGGGLRAVGVGAGVTGYGANLIIIDDPVKSREQANSERFREKLWDWYNDDLQTRLEPGGAIILIQTRWHEDDLAGRLLREAENDGDQWEIVSLPALAEDTFTAETPSRGEAAENWPRINADSADGSGDDLNDPDLRHLRPSAVKQTVDEIGRRPGEALCPHRYTQHELERIRATMTEHSFAALYQQRPVPQEGGVFKRAWFKNIVDHAPHGLKWKRGYDLAVSTKQTADYTASFRVAYDAEGNLYIDGGFRRRIDFPEQRRYMIERMRLERDTEHGIELAFHGRAVMQDLRQLANVRGRRFRGVEVRGDKQERALSWLHLAEEGRLRLVRGHWNKAFVEEAAAFPHGSHDDQIDAVSLAVSMFEIKPAKLYVF